MRPGAPGAHAVSQMRVAILPSGALRLDTSTGPDEDGLSPAGRARLVQAFERGPGHALLDLGATELDAPLAHDLAFLRDIGRAFVTRLCAAPDLEERRERVEIDCPPDERERLARAVPPMDGAEYVDAEWVTARWAAINEAFADEIRAHRGPVAAWLHARHPSWHTVGKVCLHLAENRGDEEHPFAFLATYAVRAGAGGRVQHRPLAKALEESSARRDRQALLHLLVPLQRAAEQVPWLAELVDSGAVYEAMAWTPAEAHQFLRSIPAFEAAGLVVRVPDWWRAKRPPRPEVAVRVGDKKPSALGMDALLDFSVSVALGDETLTAAEVRQLLGGAGGLVRLRGQWVELDRDRLREVLSHWERVRRDAEQRGLSFLEGMRLLAGAGRSDDEASMLAAAEGWSRVEAGAWLARTLESLRGPDGLAAADPGADLRGTLRPYQKTGVAWLAFASSLRLGVCLADDMGLGKALAADTPVLTASGWREIGSLKPGDEVIGSNGHPVVVTGVYPQGIRQLYRVRFSDGAEVRADADHLWSVTTPVRRRRGNAPLILTTRQMADHGLQDAAGNRRFFIPLVAPAQLYNHDETPVEPYLLGLLLGDGGMSTHHVRFSTTEPQILDLLKQRLPQGISVKHLGRCDYALNGPGAGKPNPLIRALHQLGLMRSTSHTKFIPDPYLWGSPATRLLVLRGLLDTDGEVGTGGTARFSTVSRRLADGVTFIVRSLGGTVREHRKGTSHRLTITLPRGTEAFVLERKRMRASRRLKYPPGRAVVAIEADGEGAAVCIAVNAADSLYVVKDFIVTHNTIQVLALLLLRRRRARGGEPPSLLVAPASLLANWQAEIERFAPSLTTLIAHPSAMPARELADLPGLVGTDLVITTYGTLARTEALRARDWSLVVLDEAQAIKNPGARQTQAVKAVRAQARIALTGTPVENRLGDLWSLYDFLDPGLLGSAREFSAFVKRLAERRDESYAPLRRLIQPYLLRRLKTDRAIVADLPDKTEVKAFCLLSSRQAGLYQKTVDELERAVAGKAQGIERRGLVLAYLMRLKQICNHPAHWLGEGSWDEAGSGKLARLREIVEPVAARQEKLLAFTQFREATEPLAAFLADCFGRPGLVLHGSTPVRARGGLVRRFQDDPAVPFFVLSVKAGGTGLNLTAASHVVHFDRWWNPAVEDQATDRAYRIGQHRNVLVHKLVCRGTVEERIDRLIEDKQALARGVLTGGGETLLTEMSDAELMAMVALDLRRATAEA